MNEKALKRKSYLDKAKPNRNQNIGPKRQSSDRNVTHTRQDTLPHFLPQTKEENRKGECHPCMVSTGFDVSVSRLTFQGEDSTTPSDLGSITSKQMNEKASKRKSNLVTAKPNKNQNIQEQKEWKSLLSCCKHKRYRWY